MKIVIYDYNLKFKILKHLKFLKAFKIFKSIEHFLTLFSPTVLFSLCIYLDV